MVETQIFFIGTSKAKEIRAGGEIVEFDWGGTDSWTEFKEPVASSSKKVKYNKKTKNTAGASMFPELQPTTEPITVLGTEIPNEAERIIDGVSRTCEVKYEVRGYTVYTRTSALTRQKKMKKSVYTKENPYEYRLHYKDKPIVNAEYSRYENGIDYIYFSDHYYDDEGNEIETSGHFQHPSSYDMTYTDIKRNFDTSAANNTDGRDNSGVYVLSNVRPNVAVLNLVWTGVDADKGADLIDTLNPKRDETGEKNYLVVQYLDYATNKVKTGTFFASDRVPKKFNNGKYQEIKVTLTEV